MNRNDVRYWQDRVFRPKSVRAAGVIESPQFFIRLHRAGRRMAIALSTENRREAAERARERYQYLVANGWEIFLAKYQIGAGRSGPDDSPHPLGPVVTVGDYLEAVKERSELGAHTIESYAKPFRLLVAEMTKIRGSKRRFDYKKGGQKKWLAAVHSVPLSAITPDKVAAWRKHRIAKAGSDKLARRRALITANSTLRQARALFSQRNVIAKLKGVDLPSVLPFDGIEVERINNKFFGAGIDPRVLLRDALTELKDQNLPAFLLLLTLGLRRREADLAEWSSFDFEVGTFRIQPTKWYQLKTTESAATLPVEPEILALFKGWHARASGPFILESPRPPKHVSYQYYRFDFQPLLDWLATKGLQGAKKIHTLRKLYGSLLSDLHGIHAASSGLRHSDIRTTSEFYADRSVKVTPRFGAVISGVEAVVPFPGASNKKTKKNPSS